MTTAETDTCLRLVADEHRRQLIRQLRQEPDGRLAVDELVTRLQGDEHPGRKQVAIQLYHTHLPKLADHDVVEYDSEAGIVRYRPNEQLEAVLDALAKDVLSH